MSEPKIWSKGFVTADCLVTVSHSDAVKPALYDRDNASKWISDGANDDTTEVSIEVEFFEGLTAVDREIDRLLLINHNLKNWEFFTWDGEDWVSQAAETDDDEDTTLKTFTPVTTSKIRLVCDETQTADAEKFVGELIVAKETIALEDFDDISVRYRERSREMILADGTLHRIFTPWSANRTEKYECRFRLDNVIGTPRETLKSLCEAKASFLFYPESDFRPDEIFLVLWIGGYQEQYSSSIKGYGVSIPVEIKEI